MVGLENTYLFFNTNLGSTEGGESSTIFCRGFIHTSTVWKK